MMPTFARASKPERTEPVIAHRTVVPLAAAQHSGPIHPETLALWKTIASTAGDGGLSDSGLKDTGPFPMMVLALVAEVRRLKAVNYAETIKNKAVLAAILIEVKRAQSKKEPAHV